MRTRVPLVSVRWQDSTLTLAEPNPVSSTLAHTPEYDRVSIEQELSLLASWQLDWFLAAPAELQHGPILVLLWA